MKQPQSPPSAAEGRTSTHSAEPSAEVLRVLRRFRQVFNAVRTHFREVEKVAGIGGAQLWALSVVRTTPGITVGELAKAMDVHQTTASNLVKGLLALGLLESHRNGVDRRSSMLKVAPAGTRLLRRAPGPFSGVLPEALSRLDEAMLRRLDADLAALLAELGADARAAKIPLAQM